MNSIPANAWHRTWSLMWPVMLANASMPLLGLVDTAVLGHLDDSVYLAGVALGSSLMAFVFWGFNFLSMGLSGFTSQAYGARNTSLLRTQLAQYSLVALLLISLVLAIHPWLIAAGLNFMDASDAATEEAQLYLSIRVWGVPAQIFNTMLLGFFTGMQNTRISLYTVSLAQMVNLVLDVILVYGFGLTTAGIALGTVLSEYLALALVLLMLTRTLRRLDPGLDRTLLRRIGAYKAIFTVSASLFLRTFLLLSGFAWFNRMGAQFGNDVLAANAILLTFLTLISNTLDGSAAASEAQVGLAIGRGRTDQLRTVLWTTGLAALALMTVMSLCFALAGGLIIDLLTGQAELEQLARHYLPWIVALPLSGGLAFWLDGVFIGARMTQQMRNGVIFGFALFIGSSFILPATNHWLWFGFSLLFVGRSIWMLSVFRLYLIPKIRQAKKAP